MSHPHRLRSWMPALLVAALCLPAGAAASAQREQVIVGRDLVLHRGRIVAIDAEAIRWRDAAGQESSMPLETCAGFVAPHVPAARRVDPGVLLLADGQRIPGRPELRGGKIVWVNALLGAVALDPERMAGLSVQPGLAPPDAGQADIVLLANGDRLEGIVEAIGAQVQLHRDDDAGGPLSIPFERVAAIGLVAAPASPGPARAWLDDGTVVDAEAMVATGDSQLQMRNFRVPSETRSFGMPMELVRGVRFGAAAFAPLASLDIERLSGPPERFHLDSPLVIDSVVALDLAPIRLGGPVSVAWTLPKEARRFVASASIPDEGMPWGDLELVVADGVGELARFRLSRESRGAAIDVRLREGPLLLTLEEGRFGAVGDFVLLELAAVGFDE